MIVIVFFTLLAAVKGQPATGCQPIYDNLSPLIAALNSALYPPAAFTKQCVSQACPALSSSPCPYLTGSTTNINATAIQEILGTITSCVQTQSTICDTPVQNISICATGVTMQGLFNSQQITGNLTVISGTGLVSGIPSFMVALDPVTGNYIINVTVVYKGQGEGYIGLAGNDTFLHFQNVPASLTLNVGAVTSINPSQPTNPVTVISTTISKQVQIGTLFPEAPNNQNVATIQSALTYILSQPVQGAATAQAIATFIGTILAQGCLVAEANCSKLNS